MCTCLLLWWMSTAYNYFLKVPPRCTAALNIAWVWRLWFLNIVSERYPLANYSPHSHYNDQTWKGEWPRNPVSFDDDKGKATQCPGPILGVFGTQAFYHSTRLKYACSDGILLPSRDSFSSSCFVDSQNSTDYSVIRDILWISVFCLEGCNPLAHSLKLLR